MDRLRCFKVRRAREGGPQVCGLRGSRPRAPRAVETGGHAVASLLRPRVSSVVLAATNVARCGVAVVIAMVAAEVLAAAAPTGPRLVGWPEGCEGSPKPCLAGMARCGLSRQAASPGVGGPGAEDPGAGGPPARGVGGASEKRGRGRPRSDSK